MKNDPFQDFLDKNKNPFEKFKDQLDSETNLDSVIKNLSDSIKKTIKANKYTPPQVNLDEEISKRLPDLNKLKDEIIRSIPPPLPLPPPPPQKIIEKIIEKSNPVFIGKQEKIDTSKFAEKSMLQPLIDERETLKSEIEGMKSIIERLKSFAVFHGGSGVIGLPRMENQSGKFLTNNGNQPSWSTVSGGGTPGGSNQQIQYNNSGVFGGIPIVTYDGSNFSITVLNIGTNITFPDATVQTTAYPGNNPIMNQSFS